MGHLRCDQHQVAGIPFFSHGPRMCRRQPRQTDARVWRRQLHNLPLALCRRRRRRSRRPFLEVSFLLKSGSQAYVEVGFSNVLML